VATDASMRSIFAITLYNWNAFKCDCWTCEIIDVEAAFLEGDMEEKIYIEWPDGILDFGFENEKEIKQTCILLEKAMYGTVQAALQFFKKLVENLTLVGLEQSKVDPCVFFIKKQGELILLIGTHVDDCAVAGKPADIEWFKSAIKEHFTIKELGTLCKHLGVWYEWGEDSIGRYLEASMEDFVEVMLADYKTIFKKAPKPAMTPAFPGQVLCKNDGNTILHKEYRSLVGKLLYFVKKIGPVCANACRELSQHLENPGTAQWNAVERLLGYIANDERNRKLKMRPPKQMRVQDVVDSSFGDNPDTRKSTSAYMGTIGGHALVNWISKGQPIVTVSSTEAEYVALSDGSKETTFITNLLLELVDVILPSLLSEDNTGAIFLAKNQQVGARTKHIDVRYHFIREKVKSGQIHVSYVNTLKNPADLLSKNVTQKVHDTHAMLIMSGLMDCWDKEQGVGRDQGV
jgi:Reverse transcriptase (RNA-dependent DNA polymerase)